MKNGLFLITGTSKGIGEALAQNLLEKGNTVIGVSRNRSEQLESKKYYEITFDLSDTSGLDNIIDKADEIYNSDSFEFLCLVNNAAILEPIKSIENCSTFEIESHFHIGLITPVVLTSKFIKKFSGINTRKKIVFISSGAAIHAMPDMSPYCSSKAGINMFSECVGLEQKNRENAFEVISLTPGMVETSMQQISRSKTVEEFAMVDLFRNAFKEGKVQDRNIVAKNIVTIINNKYEYGKFINCNDI